MVRKSISVLLILALALGLAACGGESGVSVQRADQLRLDAAAGQRYAAMVISEDVTEIRRDSGKSVLELYVTVGQEVKAGDSLFTYDSEALELELEKQQLELEKMKNEQVTYAEQLEKLEKQLKNTWNESAKTRLTLEINTLKTTILENDYSIASKENSIADIQATLETADIVSPVDGVIRQINEQDGAESYITIQQSGAYRVKGALNEMSMMGGLMPGSRVRCHSRLEAGKYWEGTVSTIDTDDVSQDESDMWYGSGMDVMNSSSSYVFYVELDNTDGLLLGQHLYVELAPPEELPGLWIPEAFIAEYGFNEETGESTGTLWVAGGSGKLESRTVTLGGYDGMSGSYEILSGLSGEEYVADPMDPGCEAGAAVTYREPSDFTGGEG
jgi:HlyD family secretion protein